MTCASVANALSLYKIVGLIIDYKWMTFKTSKKLILLNYMVYSIIDKVLVAG